MTQHIARNRKWNWKLLAIASLFFNFQFSIFNSAQAQAPGTTPVTVSYETQIINGRKYYVHIVEKGQTVYSISKAYKVQSYDAVTHKDIHFLHPGDTVWLPFRGQFSAQSEEYENPNIATQHSAITPPPAPVQQRPIPSTQEPSSSHRQLPSLPPSTPPAVRKPGNTIRMSLLMPLHLNQIDEISTSKFDIEQRGKKTYRQFEFIEFYEGIRMALDQLAEQGISVDINVVDMPQNTAEEVNNAFVSRSVANADFIVALLFREAFDRAAALARDSGVHIVNPMATRSEICADNPYMVKIQPSLESQISRMLDNMKAERPDAHLYIIHSGSNTEKNAMAELKRQLTERGDIKYTIFNWSQSSKLTATLKSTPGCNVLSLYDQKNDQMRVFVSNLLNRLSAFKTNTPTLYTLTDWTHEFPDIDFTQLQLLNYHTFYTSWDMSNTVHIEFLKSFRQHYGTEPTSSLAATGYDLTTYIINGLHRHNHDFWTRLISNNASLVHPLHLNRKQAGLENDRPILYRMESLRFVPTIAR